MKQKEGRFDKFFLFCCDWFWRIIVVILIVIFIVSLIERVAPFNPDTDICLLSCSKYCIDKDCCECRGRECYTEGDLDNEGIVCAEWRPKTKCESDPEAEGCICDEWINQNIAHITINASQGEIIRIGGQDYFKPFNESVVIKTNYDVYESKCIESHEPVYQYMCNSTWVNYKNCFELGSYEARSAVNHNGLTLINVSILSVSIDGKCEETCCNKVGKCYQNLVNCNKAIPLDFIKIHNFEIVNRYNQSVTVCYEGLREYRTCKDVLV